MKYSYLVILSFLILITALCYVFWWHEEESSYLQEDTRLILTAEYLKKHPRGMDQSQEISDSAKYVSYVKAVHFDRVSRSHHQYSFVVVSLVDETTGNEKEICLPSFWFRFLIQEEYHLTHSDSDQEIIDSLILHNKSRRFSFKDLQAYDLMDYAEYSPSELAAYRELINIDSIKEALFTNPFINYTLTAQYSEHEIDDLKKENYFWYYSHVPEVSYKEGRMLAHIMFNHGIPMGARGLFDNPKFKLPREKIWMDWIYQETNWKAF